MHCFWRFDAGAHHCSIGEQTALPTQQPGEHPKQEFLAVEWLHLKEQLGTVKSDCLTDSQFSSA
jgi:hypothetical protein